MNASYSFWMLPIFLLLGTVSFAENKERIETISTREVNSGWKVSFDGSASEPVIHNGAIYIGSFGGGIYAIDPKSGNQIWRYQTGIGLTSGPEIIQSSEKSFGDMMGAALQATEKKGKGKREIDATPVIEENTVYVGSKDYNFYALDAQTGELRWVTDIDQPIWGKALVTDKHIIVQGVGIGRSPSAIYVLRKTNGQIMWSTKGEGSATYPTIIGNVVYYSFREEFGSSNFFMNAVEANTGKLLWTRELQASRPGRVYISGDIVYVRAYVGGGLIHNANNTVSMASKTARIYAVNVSTGKLVWEFKGGSVDFSTELLVEPKNIIFITSEGLYAINKNTGKQAWFLEGNFSPSNITVGKFLYVHGDSTRKDNKFYVIDPKTGKAIWNYQDKNIFYTKVSGDTVYLSTEESLVALNASTGKKLWKFKTGGFFKAGTNVSATPLVFKNHVIFPTRTNIIWGKDDIQGYLYSIDARTGKIE